MTHRLLGCVCVVVHSVCIAVLFTSFALHMKFQPFLVPKSQLVFGRIFKYVCVYVVAFELFVLWSLLFAEIMAALVMFHPA